MPKRKQLPSDYDGTTPLYNERHEAFCVAYVGECRGNGAAAYRAAGYKTLKTHTDSNCAALLLENTGIRKRIAHLEKELAEKEKLKAIDAIRHLKAVSTVTLADFMDELGRIDRDKLKNPQLAQAIQELVPIYDKDGCLIDYKIKLKDSMRALELLGLTEKTSETTQAQQILVIKV